MQKVNALGLEGTGIWVHVKCGLGEMERPLCRLLGSVEAECGAEGEELISSQGLAPRISRNGP